MAHIVLAFQGTGKTYFCEKIAYTLGFQCKDQDFKSFEHTDGWIERYVDELENDSTNDIIFCNICKELMEELTKRKIAFYVITPLWYSARGQEEDFLTLKEILFGRYVLRKSQTPQNVCWLEKVKRNFDDWTNYSLFEEFVEYITFLPMTITNNSVEKLIKSNIDIFKSKA